MSFAILIKAQMAKYFPDYKHINTHKGSGPILFFSKDLGIDFPFLNHEISFQKGKYGLNWCRPEFKVEYNALFKNNKRVPYFVHGEWGEDFNFGSDKDIEKWFEDEYVVWSKKCLKLDKIAQKNYDKISKFYDGLLEKYTHWYKKEGQYLTKKDYEAADQEENRDCIYERFLDFLKVKNHFKYQVPEFSEFDLWQFWSIYRPFPLESFVKDDYFYCLICDDFKSRGSLIEKIDPIFGKNYEFVCQKCALKMDPKELFKKG